MPELLRLSASSSSATRPTTATGKSPHRGSGEAEGYERQEAKENTEAARLWISGLEAAARRLEVNRVIDLSATPFFLRGSGYAEGTLFPWTMSDFSLMDAIECGIVKLPRIPVADNIPGSDMPMYRKLWDHIRTEMPKGPRGAAKLDPLKLPAPLQTALQALYGHYEEDLSSMGERMAFQHRLASSSSATTWLPPSSSMSTSRASNAGPRTDGHPSTTGA